MAGLDEIAHGDRIVMQAAGGRWTQFRNVTDRSAASGRFHDTRDAAIRQARWLARKDGVSVFLREPGGEGEYRLRRLGR